MKIKKWVMALLTALYVLYAVLFIKSGNWAALIWASGFILCLWVTMIIIKRQEKMIEMLNEGIDELQNEYTYKAYIHAEKCRETAIDNCRYYMGKYLAAKSEIEQLKILNHNLLYNQGTGVKNYARKQNSK
jgi:hypothetical protein